MGIVWEAHHKGVPLLGVPGITLEYFSFTFMNLQIGSNWQQHFQPVHVSKGHHCWDPPVLHNTQKEREREITKNFRYLINGGFPGHLIFSSFGGGETSRTEAVSIQLILRVCADSSILGTERNVWWRYRKRNGANLGAKNVFQSIFAVCLSQINHQSPTTTDSPFPTCYVFSFYRSMN